jgi:hypothetical protein
MLGIDAISALIEPEAAVPFCDRWLDRFATAGL